MKPHRRSVDKHDKSSIQEDIQELSRAVKKLQDARHVQLNLEAGSQQTFEYLDEQIRSLRSAFSTLSDVVVEELDSIRQTSLQRISDIESDVMRNRKALRNLRADLALCVSDAEVDRATHTSRLKELQLSLQATEDNLVECQRATSDLPDLRQALQVVESGLDEQRQQSKSLQDSDASLKEWVQQLKKELVELRSHSYTTKDEIISRTEALARDAASLAAESADQRERLKTTCGTLYQRLSTFAEGLDAQRATDLSHSRKGLEDLSNTIASQEETTRRALSVLHTQQLRARAALDEGLRASGSEVKTLQEQMKSELSSLALGLSEAKRQVEEHSSEGGRFREASTRAIHALAEIMQVSTPLVLL